MTRVAVTTAVRHAGAREFSGYLRVLDLESGDVIHTEPVPESPWRQVDPNPRGGTRGAKGMSVHGDRFVVCNSDSVFVVDSALRPVSVLTHPLAGAIHDVLAEDDGIWITAANCDLLVKLDWEGRLLRTWSWRDDPGLVGALGFRSLPAIDLGLDYRDPRVLQGGSHNVVHLNGVARGRVGLLLSFGRILDPRTVARRKLRSRLGRVATRVGIVRRAPAGPQPTPASVVSGSSSAIVLLRDGHAGAELLVHRRGIGLPSHNVLEASGGVVYNDTNGGRLVSYDRAARAELAAVAVPGDPSFARGLAHLRDEIYLVGSQQPLALHAIDLDRAELVATYELGGAPNESVYAICLLPPSFADLRAVGSFFAGDRAPSPEAVR